LAGFWKEENIWDSYTNDKALEKKYSDEAAIGHSVRIPAYIIEESSLKTLKTFAEKTHVGDSIIMKADIELPRSHLDEVEYSLWYTSIYDFPA